MTKDPLDTNQDCPTDCGGTKPTVDQKADLLGIFQQMAENCKHTGNGFMGKSWDSFVPGPQTWKVVMSKVLVLYHSDADGFASAYALWTRFKDEATYIPVQYKQPVPEIPEGTVHIYIVDFSYSREILFGLSENYDVVVIDHHQTAQADLEGMEFCIFDQTKSGCVLTWDYLYPDDTAHPLLLRYVQDRDLWKFELPHSEEVNLFIATLPLDFMVWDDYANDDDFFFCAYAAGSAIKAFRDQQIKSVLKNTRKMLLADFLVPVVNCSNNISEVGHALNEAHPEAPFSVSYCDRKDGQRSWSLRSIGEFDVSEVARMYGGGGHKNAAGFATEVNWIELPDPEFEKAFKEHAKYLMRGEDK